MPTCVLPIMPKLVSINSFDCVICFGKEGDDIFEICAIELKEINGEIKKADIIIEFSSLFIL